MLLQNEGNDDDDDDEMISWIFYQQADESGQSDFVSLIELQFPGDRTCGPTELHSGSEANRGPV